MEILINTSLIYKIPYLITIFIIGLRIVLPFFLHVIYVVFDKCNFGDSWIAQGARFLTFKTKPNIFLLGTMLGFAIILMGGTVIKASDCFSDFLGAFIIVIGYQIFLWSFGITSEFISNTFIHSKIKSPSNFDEIINSSDKYVNETYFEYEDELYNRMIRIWFEKNSELIEELSNSDLNKLIDLTGLKKGKINRYLMDLEAMNPRNKKN